MKSVTYDALREALELLRGEMARNRIDGRQGVEADAVTRAYKSIDGLMCVAEVENV